MNSDMLLKELPALKVGNNDYLVYSPYKKLFVRLSEKAVNEASVVNSLEDCGIFEFPEITHDDDHSLKVVLNITGKCNLFCEYCWAKAGPYSNEQMSPENAVKIIADLVTRNAIERIHFMGGEPTVNFEAIRAVVDYLRKADIYPLPVFYITTNGVMPDETLNWLIRNRFAFSISWDGLEEAHNYQRSFANGRESESLVRSSILQVAGSGLPLRVRMTMSKLNLPYLYESIAWLADNAVKFVHIESVSPDGRNAEFISRYAPTPEEFVDEFFRAVELAEEKGIWIMNSNLANLFAPKTYYCSSLKGRSYNFNPDGSISHCYKMQGLNDPLAEHFTVGHYGHERQFIEIDRKKSATLSSISVSQYLSCDNYPFKNFYSGGCPYRNLFITGSENKVDPNMLRMNQLLLRKALLHLYNRALSGKPSALEGYISFYGALKRESIQPYHNISELTDVDKLQATEISRLVEFTAIPMAGDPFVAIDACDICI